MATSSLTKFGKTVSGKRRVAILEAFETAEERLSPSDVEERTYLKRENAQAGLQALCREGVLEKDSYGRYRIYTEPQRTEIASESNAGVIVTYAETGEVWFTIEFPPYLRVFKPLEVGVKTEM